MASRSRAGPYVVLKPYSYNELVSIIEARANDEVVDGAVSGDARVGVTLLRQAAMGGGIGPTTGTGRSRDVSR